MDFPKIRKKLLNRINNKKDFSDKDLKECYELLNESSSAYYNTGEVILSDSDFDILKTEYEMYEDVKPLKTGAPARKGSLTEKHTEKDLMVTLGNVFNVDELIDWFKKLCKNKLCKVPKDTPSCISFKYDGCSGALQIKEGVIKKAFSRGQDGVGTDLSSLFIGSILGHKFGLHDFTLKVEIIMTWEHFEEYSKIYYEINDKNPANPRSAVSGILAMSDGCKYSKFLTIIPLKIVTESKWYNSINLVEKIEVMNTISNINTEHNSFNMGEYEYFLCDDLMDKKSLQEMYDEVIEERESLEYMIDGLVIDILDDEIYNTLGYREVDGKSSPRGSIALKFPYKSAITKLINFELSVAQSGSGRITPCVTFDPVVIDGKEYKRVSLSNFDRVVKEDFRIGGQVLLTIRGDVLGYISPLNSEEDKELEKVSIPDSCPVCGGEIVFNKTKAFLFCSNEACESKGTGKFIKYLEKMRIKNIGLATIQFLYENDYIHDLKDLYSIDYDSLEEESGYGKKKCKEIENAINSKIEVYDYILLGSLGWRSLGRSQMKLVMSVMSINDLFQYHRKLTKRDFIKKISNIEGFSTLLSQYLHDGLKKDSSVIDDLSDYLDIMDYKQSDDVDSLSFVVTGNLVNWPDRSMFKDKLELLGHSLKSGISKKVDYLITNDTRRTVKLKKAEELGIKIITEKEVIELLSLEV